MSLSVGNGFRTLYVLPILLVDACCLYYSRMSVECLWGVWGISGGCLENILGCLEGVWGVSKGVLGLSGGLSD